jgi:hypothetical protein
MTKSTLWFGCPKEDKGGYRVQPVPAPNLTIRDLSKNRKAGGSIQKERLFRRGKLISGAPIRIGINQFPKPPIKIGITAKKIITRA